MSKHTPGPWTALIPEQDDVDGIYIVDAAEDVVVRPSGGVSEANARLIAAAPDLLAALHAILDGATRGFPGCEQARAAIAKAEGAS